MSELLEPICRKSEKKSLIRKQRDRWLFWKHDGAKWAKGPDQWSIEYNASVPRGAGEIESKRTRGTTQLTWYVL